MYLKNIFKYKNHQNCILYVRSHNFDLFNYLNIEYNTEYKPIEYQYYKNSYYFDYNIVSNNIDTYKNYINELINCSILNEYIYIYIYNFNNSKKYFQLYIKNIMEHNFNTKIILITKKITSINNAIRNQCIVITHNDTVYNDNKKFNKQEMTIINILYDIYKNNNFINFKKKIKSLNLHILKNEIIIDKLINNFVCVIISKSYITFKVNKELIDTVSNINHKISNSYNKIILYEYLFIKIYMIIKPSIDIYYNLN